MIDVIGSLELIVKDYLNTDHPSEMFFQSIEKIKRFNKDKVEICRNNLVWQYNAACSVIFIKDNFYPCIKLSTNGISIEIRNNSLFLYNGYRIHYGNENELISLLDFDNDTYFSLSTMHDLIFKYDDLYKIIEFYNFMRKHKLNTLIEFTLKGTK